jgi:hypothetical protein
MSLSDLFKPKWKNSNPAIRENEVRHLGLENQSILSNIAKKDPSAEVRRAALKKITDYETLRHVAKSDLDSEIRQFAQERISEDCVRELKNASADSVDSSLFLELSETRDFEDIALNAKSANVRRKALENITRERILIRLACRDKDSEVAQLACAKIHKDKALEEVQNHSRYPAVRSEAAKRLKSKKSDHKEVQSKNLVTQKEGILLKSMERLLDSVTPSAVQTEFESLQEEWNLLSGIEKQKFEELAIAFNKALQTEAQENARKVEEAKAQLDSENAFKSMCEKAEEALHLNRSSEAVLAQLKEEWTALVQKTNPATSFTQRFESTLRKIESLHREEEHREEDKRNLQEKARDLLQQMSFLRDRDDLKNAEKHLASLSEQWSYLKINEEALIEQFQSLKQNIVSKLGQIRESVKNEISQKEKVLLGLIEQVKSLDPEEEFRDISQTLKQVRLKWKETVEGHKSVFNDLWQEFKKATERFDEMQQWEHWHNEKDKLKLCEDAEALKDVPEGRGLFDAVRNVQAAWRKSGPVSHDKFNELQERFTTACDSVFERCQEFLAVQEQERKENLAKKEALCVKAEALTDSIDSWKETANAIQQLQAEWKDIGPVPKELSDAIWFRFKASCDAFYSKHRGFLKEEESLRLENLRQKEELCEQAEKLASSTAWKKDSDSFKQLQEQWKKIGPTPRNASEMIWGRFRKACDSFFEAKRKYYEALDAEKGFNLQKKIELCEKAEALKIEDDVANLETQLEVLTQDWKSTGKVQREQSDDLWNRFLEATNGILDKIAAQDPDKKAIIEKTIEAKRTLVDRARMAAESSEWKSASETLKALQDEWRDLERSGSADQTLWKEFREICDGFFERRRDQYEIMEQQRLNNLEKKLLLVEQAETLKDRIQNANPREEIQHLRRLWKEIGPVPKAHSDKIWDQFNHALEKAVQHD